MNASTNSQQIKEKISSLIDDEHDDRDFEFLIQSLQAHDNKLEWELYHQIGDVLNSDDLSISLSASFSAKLNERLASEPTHLIVKHKKARSFDHRIAYASAAMVALIAIFAPKFAGHDGAEVSAPYFAGQFAASGNVTHSHASLVSMNATQNAVATPTAAANQGARQQMLRDPVIDSYLAAHQRYSKSMYSAVEYETGPINQEVEK